LIAGLTKQHELQWVLECKVEDRCSVVEIPKIVEFSALL
jgi:hypothetical protein